MKRSYLAILPIIFLFISFSVVAQNYVDLLKIEYSISANNTFDESNEQTDVKEFVADATIPIVLSEKNTILSGFLYENVNLLPYSNGSEVSLQTLNLKLGLNQTYSDKWSATYLLLPKISADEASFGENNFMLGFVSLFKYTKTENVNFKFGTYFNSDLFGPFFVPFFGFYVLKDKWEINALLPASFDVNNNIAGNAKLGLRFNGFIKSFNLNNPGGMPGIDQYISKANNEVLLYLGWSFGKIYAQAMVGRSIGRSYRTYQVGDEMDLAISIVKLGDERTQLNTDFSDGMVFKTTLYYRFPTNTESN